MASPHLSSVIANPMRTRGSEGSQSMTIQVVVRDVRSGTTKDAKNTKWVCDYRTDRALGSIWNRHWR